MCSSDLAFQCMQRADILIVHGNCRHETIFFARLQKNIFLPLYKQHGPQVLHEKKEKN